MIDTQSQPLFQRVAVFGVGLLGGSLGIACRRRGIADEVIGVGRNAERLEQALELGAIDRFTTDTRAGFAEADLIVMAAPVKTIIDFLPVVRDAAPDGAIVTDVGSAKSAIARVADKVFADSEMAFIGSHPMAGGEQMGVANARGDLYEGAARRVDRLHRWTYQTQAANAYYLMARLNKDSNALDKAKAAIAAALNGKRSSPYLKDAVRLESLINSAE